MTNSLQKRKKMMLWSSIIIVLAIMLLPMTGYIATGFATAESEEAKTNPRADFWRQVRDNTDGYSAVTGRESNELIQSSGQNWLDLRNGPLSLFGSWLLGFSLAVLAVFYIWRGKIRLSQPRTGETIERWSLNERRMHWLVAILFVILAITGLSLLYGRAVLIPLFGHHGFSTYAAWAKFSHNILGPAFMIGLFAMIVAWLKINFFNKIDLAWFKEFGGMVGDKHPSAEKLNGGEKLWFWLLAILGVALCLTGLVLDFPNFDQERELIQLSHIIHLVTALILVAFTFGHIYIATIGTEGALEGMISGQVDTSWAKQHHDLWLQEVEQESAHSTKDKV